MCRLRVEVVELLAHVQEDHAADERARERRVERVRVLGEADRERAAVLQRRRRACRGGGGDGRRAQWRRPPEARSALRARAAVIAFPLLWMRFPLEFSRRLRFPGRCAKAASVPKWIQVEGNWIHSCYGRRGAWRGRERMQPSSTGSRRRSRRACSRASSPRGRGCARSRSRREFGVSRTPVREALRKLQAAGHRAARAAPRRARSRAERARGARGLRGPRRARGPRRRARVARMPRRGPATGSAPRRSSSRSRPSVFATGRSNRRARRRRRARTPTGSAATTCSIS